MSDSTTKIVVSLSNIQKGINVNLKPGETTLIEIPKSEKLTVNYLEFEDVLFGYDSALVLPEGVRNGGTADQSAINGLETFVKIFNFMSREKNQKKKLLILGHADTAGDQSYNKKLAFFRSCAIQYIIGNKKEDREAWCELFRNDHKDGIRTYQDQDVSILLNWIHHTFGWRCGPLPITKKVTHKTQEAIKRFKVDYNSAYAPSGSSNRLNINTHTLCKKTWGAFFDLYQEVISEKLKAQNIVPEPINWLDDTKKSVGCGELWPIEKIENMRQGDTKFVNTDKKSQQNRRVEILFFDAEDVDHLGALNCSDLVCNEEICSIYGDLLLNKRFIPVYIWESFYLRINIGSDEQKKLEEIYTLHSNDGSYQKSRSAQDNQSTASEYIDLVYDDLIGGMTYTLMVEPSNGEEAYPLFEEVPINELDYVSRIVNAEGCGSFFPTVKRFMISRHSRNKRHDCAHIPGTCEIPNRRSGPYLPKVLEVLEPILHR